MSNTIYKEIVERANKLTALKNLCNYSTDASSREVFEASIKQHEDFINENTNNSCGYILSILSKITELEVNISNEKDSNKREIMKKSLEVYQDRIKAKICDKSSSKKCDNFRSSQKVTYDKDLLKRTKDISKMCEAHQAELKAKENNSEAELDN